MCQSVGSLRAGGRAGDGGLAPAIYEPHLMASQSCPSTWPSQDCQVCLSPALQTPRAGRGAEAWWHHVWCQMHMVGICSSQQGFSSPCYPPHDPREPSDMWACPVCLVDRHPCSRPPCGCVFTEMPDRALGNHVTGTWHFCLDPCLQVWGGYHVLLSWQAWEQI